MCVSAFPASFTGTKICMYEPDPAVLGIPIQVMLYQNTTLNMHRGPNAMLLHIDSATLMGPQNFIPTTNFRHVLDDMVQALMPMTRGGGLTFGMRGIAKSVQVFDVGIYTVVLAQDAADIPDALGRVPQDKRPELNVPLFEFYGQAFPGYSVALCCFNASAQSEPIMLWWEPRNLNMFRMPALDEHTGNIPKPGEAVQVDHWLIAGSFRMHRGDEVEYREEEKIPRQVRRLLPNNVVGRHFSGRMPNGDFGVPIQAIYQGEMPNSPQRLMPPA